MTITKIFTLTLLTILFAACSDQEAKTVVKPTPSFEELKQIKDKNIYKLTTTTGKNINIEYENSILNSKDLNGKIVLINFFATWCPPCIKEIPIFNELQEKYPDDFKIVSILFQDTVSKADLNKFIMDHNIKFDITVGEENNKLAKAFGDVQKIPESFLFTKDGIQIEKFVGAVDENAIKFIIDKLKE